MIHVYVAGPLTKGNVTLNIREACRWADELHRAQFVPYVPHTSFLADLLFPRHYEQWLAYDFAWIQRCEALLRLEGASEGADREVAFARERGVSVFGDGKTSTSTAFRELLKAFPAGTRDKPAKPAPAPKPEIDANEALRAIEDALKREVAAPSDPEAFRGVIAAALARIDLTDAERKVLAERFKDKARGK